MTRGYSSAVVLCLCALSFIVGRFVQQLPGLPETHNGFTRTSRRNPARRMAQELELAAGLPGPGGTQLEAAAGPAANATQPEAAGSPHQTYEQAMVATSLYERFPPIEPGDSGDKTYVTQPFQVLSWYPRMYLLPNFLSEEQCEHVLQLARIRLAPSSLALRKTDDATKQRDVRTSQGTFISRREDPHGVLAFMEDKAAAITGLPVSHGEPFNVLRYTNGQHYDSHYDIFEPESYGPQSSQRMITILYYLSDVEEGGETVFPLEGKHGMDRLKGIDYRSCDVGFRYHPRRGDALLFYSMHANGTFDKHALHGGCPVKHGEKWVATKWIRDQCFTNCF